MSSQDEDAPSKSRDTTILVVDDEELMREVASIMLEEQGFTVFTAVDGLDGLEVFKRNLGKIGYVFMDFSMPRMNGYESFLAMRALDPTVKVLMVSGLRIVPEVLALKNKGEIEFLSKPFHERDLIEALARL